MPASASMRSLSAHERLQGVNRARMTMVIDQGRIAAFQNTLVVQGG